MSRFRVQARALVLEVQVEDRVALDQQEDGEQEVADHGFENVPGVQDRAKRREVDDPPPSRPRAGSRRSPCPGSTCSATSVVAAGPSGCLGCQR